MANSEVHPQGWISVHITEEHENAAKRLRAKRDQQYGNIYEEQDSDERWVGDLGEFVFKSWLKSRGLKEPENFHWILDDAAGSSDFVIQASTHVGVKTVKRKVPPRTGYTAQITSRHSEEDSTDYFFMSYEIAIKKMWLLGGISKKLFLEEATYYPAGAWVHSNYQVRGGHAIYNIDIGKLVPPDQWLTNFL